MNSRDRLPDCQTDGGQRFSFENPDFESYLRALKRHGCNLLVTGEASKESFAAMSRRLLGTPSDHRVRMLALTNTSVDDANKLLPNDVSAADPDVELFEYSSPTRSATAETPSLPSTASARSDLVEFQDSICDAIAAHDANLEELAAAELRVGVADLCPLVSDYETETVAEFARTIGSEVLQACGMAHYCLPTAPHAPVVADLQPEFDARIEIRKDNGHPPMHRWYVPEHDITTPWVEI